MRGSRPRTSVEMAAVDQAMVEDYGIDLIQMMENAGRNLAHLARARFLGAGGNLIQTESDIGGDRVE